jgi:hypothetical protein
MQSRQVSGKKATLDWRQAGLRQERHTSKQETLSGKTQYQAGYSGRQVTEVGRKHWQAGHKDRRPQRQARSNDRPDTQVGNPH